MPTEYQTTQINDLPSWMRDPLVGMINTGEQLAQEPYAAYQGPRIAGFNQTQEQAFGQVDQYANSAAPYFGIGALSAGQAGVGVDQLASQYMNPYINAAIDPAAQEMERAYMKDLNRIGGQAGSNNAFGGSRQALLEQGTQRNYFEGIGDLYAQGRSAAYDRGINAAGSDQNRRAQLAGIWGGLGQGQQAAGLAGADALSLSGGMQQGMDQNRLDLAYGDFQEQEQHPYSQLSFFRSLVTGLPQVGTRQTTQQTPDPSRSSQLMGAGIAGLGLIDRAF